MNKVLRKVAYLFVAFVLLLTVFPALRSVDADATANVTILLSDSAPEAPDVTYTITVAFSESVDITGENTITFTFPDGYDLPESGNIDADGFECTIDEEVITCTPDPGDFGGEEIVLTIEGVTNPEKDSESEDGEADTYTVRVECEELWGDGFIDAMFAIVDPVKVTAIVEATLEFRIYGVDPTADPNPEYQPSEWDNLLVNGRELTTEIATSPTEINFDVLSINEPKFAAQDLVISTNASEGYTITVFQDQDLTSIQGDTISPFGTWDGSLERIAPHLAEEWDIPEPDLDHPETWGFFGFTSQDASLEYDDGYQCGSEYAEGTDYSYFNASDLDDVWAGFDGDNPESVMCHIGPSDGQTLNVGFTRVGYAIEISPLQPAGQYTNTLTYVATPTF